MRFVYLDGIRGIAALFVVARHWNGMLGFGDHLGHLAVDIFFILSGFVIAHAYDEKLRSGRLGAGDFMAIRLARLYPMYVLATLFSIAAAFMLASARNVAGFHPQEWLVSGSLLLFFLPWGVSGRDFLFPLNGVVWSLFFELVVNAAYAYGRRLLSDRVLVGIIAVTGSALVAMSVATGTIDHGFRATFASVAGGLIRSTFGIAVGLLMYRRRDVLTPLAARFSPWLGVALVAVVLSFPMIPHWTGIVELVAVFLVLPFAIAIASGQEPSDSWQTRTMLTLGIASYPIYLIHVPLGKLLAVAVAPMPELARPVAVGATVALVLLSVQLERYVDIPARQWLRDRLLRRPMSIIR